MCEITNYDLLEAALIVLGAFAGSFLMTVYLGYKEDKKFKDK